MHTSPRSTTGIEHAICSYLQSHPLALDTERGICEWWLRDARPPHAFGDVQRAVARLVASGHLRPLPLPGGQVAYRPGPAFPFYAPTDGETPCPRH